MQVHLHPEVLADQDGEAAQRILKSCVQCGFCTAACPTYLETGNELDGPRGRINLMQVMLEENTANATGIYHLDRCLTCRACETACPSDVAYGDVLQFTRERYALTARRPAWRRFMRGLWLRSLQSVWLGRWGYQLLRWLWPRFGPVLSRWLPPPPPRPVRYRLESQQKAKGPTLVLLPGCVQSYISPQTLAAAEAVLRYLGAEVQVAPPSCCGAMDHHAGFAERARHRAQKNIHSWSRLAGGLPDAVVSLASGCSLHIKDYPNQAPNFARYNPKSIEEVISLFDLNRLPKITKTQQIAWQPPCTLTHGLKIDDGCVPDALGAVGYHVLPVADRHCCGSAGLYSLEQQSMSQTLGATKMRALMMSKPDVIATANIGCQLHLAALGEVPVRHWIELLAEPLRASS